MIMAGKGREDIRISHVFSRKLVLRREENLDASGHRLLHHRGLLWGKMSSWDPQGGIKDDEPGGGGICVGKCSLFLLLACRARERSRPEVDAAIQGEERLSSDYEGIHFKLKPGPLLSVSGY